MQHAIDKIYAVKNNNPSIPFIVNLEGKNLIITGITVVGKQFF